MPSTRRNHSAEITDLVRRLIWGAVLVGVLLYGAANFTWIKQRVMGLTVNAEHMREAKEVGTKILNDSFSNWNPEPLGIYADPAQNPPLLSDDLRRKFGAWNAKYGTHLQRRTIVELRPGSGDIVDFGVVAQAQTSIKPAKITLRLRRMPDGKFFLLGVDVVDGDAKAAQ